MVKHENSRKCAFGLFFMIAYCRRANDVDEYYRYIREPLVPHSHIQQGVYTWWLEERQQRLYSNLSRMALDILTIPAMSAVPERLFSSANITISDRRNRLHSDTTEAIECLKSWRKLTGMSAIFHANTVSTSI
jgi:hypothetical protein